MGMSPQEFLSAGGGAAGGTDDPEDPKMLLGVDPKRDAPMARTLRNINNGVPAAPMHWQGQPIEAGTGAVVEETPAPKGMSAEEFLGKKPQESSSSSAPLEILKKTGTNLLGLADMILSVPGMVLATGADIGTRLNELVDPLARGYAPASRTEQGKKALEASSKIAEPFMNPLHKIMTAFGYGEDYTASDVSQAMGLMAKGIEKGGDWIEKKSNGVLTTQDVQSFANATMAGLGAWGTAKGMQAKIDAIGKAKPTDLPGAAKTAAEAKQMREADYSSPQEFTADLHRAAEGEALSAVDKARNAEQQAYNLMQEGASKKKVEAIRKQNPAVGEALDRMMERRGLAAEGFRDTYQGEVIPADQYIPDFRFDNANRPDAPPIRQIGTPTLRLPAPDAPLLEDLSGRFAAEGAARDAAQAAAEAAGRQPTGRGTLFQQRMPDGRLEPVDTGMKGATPDALRDFGTDLQRAAEKQAAGRGFDMTAEERIAWNKATWAKDQLQGGKADPKLLALIAGLGLTVAGFLSLDPADQEDAKSLGLGVALLGGLKGKDNVTELITKPIRDFHKALGQSVRERMQKTAELVEAYDGWQWQAGDRVKGSKGDVYKITGRTWDTRTNSPRYWYESVLPEGTEGWQRGMLNADKAHETMTKLDGPRKLEKGEADPRLLAGLAALGVSLAAYQALGKDEQDTVRGFALAAALSPAPGALKSLGSLLKENPYGFKLLERLPQDRHTFTKKQVWEQVAREDIPVEEKELVRYTLLQHPKETITASELVKQLNVDTADWTLTSNPTPTYADYGLDRIGRTADPSPQAANTYTDPLTMMYDLPFEVGTNNHFGNPRLFGWVRSFVENGKQHVVELQSDLVQRLKAKTAVNTDEVYQRQIETNTEAERSLNAWSLEKAVLNPYDTLADLREANLVAYSAMRDNLAHRADVLGLPDLLRRQIHEGNLSELREPDRIRWLRYAQDSAIQNWLVRNIEMESKLQQSVAGSRLGPLAKDWEARLVREEMARAAHNLKDWKENLVQHRKALEEAVTPEDRAWYQKNIDWTEQLIKDGETVRFATPDTVAKVEGWPVADPIDLRISAAGVSPVFVKASPITVFGREIRIPGTGRWMYTKEEGLQKEIILDDGSSVLARVAPTDKEAWQVLTDYYSKNGYINKLFEDTVTKYLELQKRKGDQIKQMSRAEVEAALKPAWDGGVYLALPQTAGIYTRYKRVVEPILRKLGGIDYTDPKGHTWIEVPVRPDHAQPKMFGQSGKADPRLLARMAAVGLGTAIGLWASDKDHKWMGAALGALVGAGAGMGPAKLVNTWKGLWKPDTRLRIDGLTNAWEFAQDKAAKLAWDLQRSVEKLVPDEAGRARITQWLDGNKNIQLQGAELRAATMVRAWFEGMRKSAQAAGVLNTGLDNYVTHLWDWKAGSKQSPILEAFWARMEGRGAGMGTKSPYAKERSFSTLEEGKRAGLTPLTEDISAIIGIYSNSMSRAMANKALVEGIKQAKLPNGIKLVLPHDKAPHFYENVDGLQGVKVHPDIAPSLQFLYSKAPGSALAVGAEMLNTALKRSAVSFSLFHVKALFDAGLAGTDKPLKFIKDLPAFASGTTDLLKQLRQQGLTPMIELAYQSGLKFGLERGARAMEDVGTDSFYAGLKGVQKGLDSAMEGLGAPVKGLAEFNHKFDTFMWDWVHTGMKLNIFAEKVESLMAASAKRHAADPSVPLLTKEQAGAIAASYTNDLLGGLNWRRLAEASSTKWGRNLALQLYSRSGRWWAQLALFAPDWTLSTTRAMTQAFSKGSGVKGLLEPTTLADLHRQYLARAGAYYFVIGNVLNQALSGHWLWENEDPTSIDMGDGRKLQWSKHTMEPVHWGTRPGQQAVNKMGILPKEALEQALNVDYLSTKGNMRPMEGSRIEHAAKKMLPISAASSFESGAESGLLGFAGIPIHGRKKSDIAYERVLKRVEKLQRKGE